MARPRHGNEFCVATDKKSEGVNLVQDETCCLILFLVLGLRETIQGLRDFQSLYIEGFVLLFYIEGEWAVRRRSASV